MFDVWFDDLDRTIAVEPFGQHIARILGDAVAHSCFCTRSCHRFFLGISPDGDLFPCGMFQGESAFRYSKIPETKDYYGAGYRMYFEHALRRVHEDVSRATRACRVG
ncbi:hypothetical protein ABZO31_31465 [Streptomyces sp. HUAS MG47]|uniref:hypothetical protein n=1 Tax=Streptomyces solicamelliae TaxID=3231716 RepID=UPI003877EF97